MSEANDRLFGYQFGKIYALYIQKAERKGRTKAEVDEVICWLSGHSAESLVAVIHSDTTLKGFFDTAPALNPARELITGSVCGVKVQEIENPDMRNIRFLDKLIDELAKGKAMDKILRG
jgi:hypothetical protein